MTNARLLVGFALWLAAWTGLRLPLEAAILLLAPLALVPLGLRSIEIPKSTALETALIKWTRWLQLPAATTFALSFSLPQSYAASALVLPWFVVTLLLALAGFLRLRRLGIRLDCEAGTIAALLFIAVGGGWAVISRAGLRPQDFSHPIVLLTAVHFHYAGFVLPLIAACIAKELQTAPRSASGSWIDRLMLASIIVGVPAVGLGISLSPHIEVAAAFILAIGCLILGARQIQAALVIGNPTRISLAAISSLSLASAMALAAIYALGEYSGHRWIDVPAMIRTHGAFNAFGFAACGVAAWTMATKGTNVDPT
jgi:hypothetical protein